MCEKKEERKRRNQRHRESTQRAFFPNSFSLNPRISWIMGISLWQSDAIRIIITFYARKSNVQKIYRQGVHIVYIIIVYHQTMYNIVNFSGGCTHIKSFSSNTVAPCTRSCRVNLRWRNAMKQRKIK